MSVEEVRGMKGLVGDWFEFEGFRKQMETTVHDLELSNFNLHYGVRTELEFREKLKLIRILLDKIENLIGPPPKEAGTLVA